MNDERAVEVVLAATELIALRFSGGPIDGATVVPRWAWPPPARLRYEDGGFYEKVSQSDLADPVPGVVRGAEYRWVEPDDAPAGAGDGVEAYRG